MTAALAKPQDIQAWTPEQKALIKKTCAPDSSDDELSMYLHVAAASGLDPLRRQLHFMKVKGRVTFIADVNGLQERAAKEPDFRGLLHAVVYEKDEFLIDQKTGEVVKHASNPFNAGKPVGAWAVCFREGMKPFVSCVRFAEYANRYNPLWESMPSVMIDKCAKSTVLRLAYPGRFGGIYDRAEIREEKEINPLPKKDTEQAERAAEVKEGLKSRRMQVVDVQPGETEQQATERAKTEETKALPPPKEPTIWERVGIACKEFEFKGDIRPTVKELCPGKKHDTLTADDLLKIQEWLANWAESQREKERVQNTISQAVGFEPVTEGGAF